ncbi:hypothetical protein PMAYCL1PPCAC_28581, partial [Pristionchus mayeri]
SVFKPSSGSLYPTKMVREDKSAWKAAYFAKVADLFDRFPKCAIVNVDNVGSKQLQMIRHQMRDEAVILLGKNTLIRKAIRSLVDKNPAVEKILPRIVDNVGLVFTKEDLPEIRDKLIKNKRGAPAKAGSIAPSDVHLPPQNTGMAPDKTSFFQALQIPTKIVRGSIEIINEVHLISSGDKVGASEAALLNMLGITPFSYGLDALQVYDDGVLYSPHLLDLSASEIRIRFLRVVRDVAALSLAISYPTAASVAHSLAIGLLNMLAVSTVTDIAL